MRLTGNTILITGGGAGIGRGLAEEFHRRGNQVIIAGRRGDVLRDVAQRHPGMRVVELDVSDPTSIAAMVSAVLDEHPTLNVVVNNAGIMFGDDVTHPLDDKTGCVISKKIKVPADTKARLRLVVAHDPQGDFDLIVRADGRELLRKAVSKATATEDPWLVQEVDLSGFAGKKAPKIEIINQPSGWSFEAAYWGEIAIITE